MLRSSLNLKSSLAVEVVAEEVHERVEVEAVPHVQVEGSRLRRLQRAQPLLVRPLRARPLGQVLRAQPLVLGLPVERQARRPHKAVLQARRRRKAVVQARRRRKAALAPAALRQGKALRLHSSQAVQAQKSQAAVQRLAK